MEDRKVTKISLSTFLLIFAIIIIIIMGVLIVIFINEKNIEEQKIVDLQSQVDNLNNKISSLQTEKGNNSGIDNNSSNNSNFKLKIKESSWSGWKEDYKPKETTKEYDVVLEKEYNISRNLKFVIKKINSDSIVIKTEESFSVSETGVNLNTDKKEFTVYLDKELELRTPTMDAGDIYIFKLVK